MDRVRRVSETFDDWARRGRAEGMERGHSAAARQGFDLLDLRRDSWYLDVGCGNGYSVRWAAEVAPDGRAVGIDVAPEMIARAREMSAGLANVEFRHTEIPGTGLSEDRFDAVFSMEALYYVPDLDGAVAEIARLLAPGGRFACLVNYYAENEASHSWPEDVGVEMTLLDSAGWRGVLERAGLEVVDQRRLREQPGESEISWHSTEGSLLTLGARPADGPGVDG
jgi:SAM-dependent methyltransferase